MSDNTNKWRESRNSDDNITAWRKGRKRDRDIKKARRDAAKANRSKRLQEGKAARNVKLADAAYVNSANSVFHNPLWSKEDSTVDYMKRFLKQDSNGNLAKDYKFDRNKIIGKAVGVHGKKTGEVYDDLSKHYASAIAQKAGNQFAAMERLQGIATARNKTQMQDIFGTWTDKTTAVKRGGGVNNMYGFTSMESFARAGVLDHTRRALQFATGAGFKDDLLNSIGLRTSHQKNIMKSASSSRMDKVFAGVPAQVSGIFALSEALPYVVGNKESTLTDNAATAVGTFALASAASVAAFRVTKETVHAGTSLLKLGKLASKSYRQAETVGKLGWAGRAAGLAKWTTGAVPGLMAGAAAFMAVDTVGTVLRSFADRENSISRLKDKLYAGDTRGDASIKTRQALTGRQRAMQKLSKSALNDKAYLLGNEAMILKGIY